MKEGWKINTLKELSIISGDYGLSVPSKPFDGVRYLRITDITNSGDLNDDKVSANIENKKQEELQEGDVLFARTGATVGKTLVFRKEFGECLYAGYLIRYRLNKDIILPRYMHYITHSNEYYDWVATNQEAAAQPNISAKKYNLLPVRYPSLEEQQRIVSYLDAAFAQIDALKANAKKQLDEARKLFQKALEEMLEPREGWEEKSLKEISAISGDYGLNVSSKPFDGIRYLRITDITDWGELNEDKVSANVDDGKGQDELEEGDILFARTGATVGKTLVYRKEFGECLFAGYLIRYRLNKDMISPRYMHYVTHSKEYYDWVIINQEAAAQPNISAKKYNLLPIRFPSLSSQLQIVSRLDALSEKVRELEQLQRKTIAECDALKQAMLREVFE